MHETPVKYVTPNVAAVCDGDETGELTELLKACLIETRKIRYHIVQRPLGVASYRPEEGDQR
jgi:hypothetical protein